MARRGDIVEVDDINGKRNELVVSKGRKDGSSILNFRSGRWAYAVDCEYKAHFDGGDLQTVVASDLVVDAPE